jgi:hypothetical protein
MVSPREYQEEHFVLKDAEYFDEVRRAVAWTSPIALFGTSGLAAHQRIESAQDFELRKQLAPERYSRYHLLIEILRLVTAVIPWLSISLIPFTIMSFDLSVKDISGVHIYALIGLILAIQSMYFLIAKFIQVAFWRLGSTAIRYWIGVSKNSRLDDSSSESDVPD